MLSPYSTTLSRILLIAGAVMFVTSLFLPAWQDVYTSHSSDLDYGFSWGEQQGYEIWIISGMSAFTIYSPFLGIPAFLGLVQVYYPLRRVTSKPHPVFVWTFVITSIATPIFLYFTKEASYPLVGYYVWQGGYWLTTVGLLMRTKEQV
jgi:hypothetical protein